jgi:hypothetical protein
MHGKTKPGKGAPDTGVVLVSSRFPYRSDPGRARSSWSVVVADEHDLLATDVAAGCSAVGAGLWASSSSSWAVKAVARTQHVDASDSVGTDTRGEVHADAAMDEVGGLLGTRAFDATPVGYSALLSWLAGFGSLGKVVEGTFGAGLVQFDRG